MKNYKFIVPIFLVLLFAGSIYMLLDTRSNELKTYNSTLEAARSYREQDIRVDAESYYKQALEQKPSLELYLEIGDFYRDTEQVKKATDWGVIMTKEYPQEVSTYEYLLSVYDERQDYVACFDVAETVEKRGLQSKVLDEILQRIEYTFYFNGGYRDVGIYSGGLSPVLEKELWGYVDESGNEVVPAVYSVAGPFIEGLAPVVDKDGAAYYIDAQGNKKHVVLGVDHVQQLGLMESEMFSLYDGKSWGFYNTDNEHLFGQYQEASAIGNGVAAVKSNDTWSLVDRSGNDLTGKTYDAVAMDEKQVVYRNERLFVLEGEQYTMITSSGEPVGEDYYDDVCIFFDTTYAAVKIDGKWGFVDKDGNMVIQPQFQEARSFSNGMAAVKQNGQWGFVDMQGEMVITPQFDQTKDFNAQGCVFVFDGDEWRLLRLYKSNH